MSESNGSGEVRFTIKELVSDIHSKLGSIEAKLDQKADGQLVEMLRTRIEKLERWRAAIPASLVGVAASIYLALHR